MSSLGYELAPKREGLIPFTCGEGSYQTFYKIFGDLADKKHTPVVVIHGGPGMVHDYLLAFTDLYTKDSIPVVFYDQIGNGLSTHLPHKPSEFWTIDLFIDELVNLVNHLGIKDCFDIVGHSWGGMLACEFEVRRQPAGLRRLVLSNSAADMGLRRQSGAQLIQPFPEEVKEGLTLGFKDREKYCKALEIFYAVHCCRVHPFPLEFQYALDQTFGANGDPTVSSTECVQFLCLFDVLAG
ncbi:hypothetical protein CVT26_003260 [Gymnopilus dilepis]|uniref:AB hydrolase-1 domain-containing protein n=1 Tax=Gymnopilus dilepis TaxID=231916 RepID=A0A409Y525_9AGAR|nr:hypothetical protein CVT26_003260 [Gymnopilus dilepis]